MGGSLPGWDREQITAIAAVFLGLASGYTCAFGGTMTTFILPLVKEFHWGRTVPSLMFAAATIGLGVSSIWIGRLIGKFGFASVAAVSGVLLAGTLACLSLLQGSPVVAIILCFLAGALGVGTGVGLYISVLPHWFDLRLGRALGLSIVGQSAGLTLFPWLSATIIQHAGWRRAYLVLAGCSLILTLLTACILSWLAARGRKRRTKPSYGRSTDGVGLRVAVRTGAFWCLAAAILFATIGVFGTMVHVFPLYADRGVAPTTLPAVGVALGAGTLVGRFSSGVLLDYVEPRIVGTGTFLIGAAAIFWLAMTESADTVSIILPPALIGLALGAETDVLAYFVRRLFGMRGYVSIYNRLLISYYAGAVIGPIFLGWSFDHFDNPSLAIIALGISCVAAALTFYSLPSLHGRESGAVLSMGTTRS